MDDPLIETATRRFFEDVGKKVEAEVGSIESLRRATWGQVVRFLYEYGWELIKPDGELLIPWEDEEEHRIVPIFPDEEEPE